MANVKHERIRSVLLQIVESSRSLQTKTTKDDSIPVRLNAEHNPSRSSVLNFPPPHDFSLELGSMGVIEPISKKVADAFRSRCNQLQALVNDRLCEMQHRCSPSVQPLLRSYLQNFYNENVDEFKAELLRSIEQHRSKFTVAHNKSANKPLFNSDFVPFLEKYFEFNAYPSAADRILMAKKSMMTPRQIEVWFQNHRNRARKEGKCLPRLHPSDKLPDLGLAGLEESMSDFIKSEPEKSNSDESDSEDTEPRNQGEELHIEKATVLPNALEPLSSTHAFPYAYLAPQIPFSRMTIEECTPVFSGAPLPWPRSPSSPTPTPSKHRLLTKSQISELSDLFARLTVREGSRKVMRRKATPPPTKPSFGSAHAAACATTTVLHKGRHPSFVSTPSPPSSSIFSSFLATDRCSSTRNVHPPSVRLSDTVLSPSSSHRRRKSPQLPRRVPGSTPSSHTRVQHMHHPYASPSRESSSSSSCRTPSSSSESSSTPRTPDNFNPPLPLPFHLKSTSTSSYDRSPWSSYFNLPHLRSPSPSPLQSNPSWFPQDLFLHNPFGVSALC